MNNIKPNTQEIKIYQAKTSSIIARAKELAIKTKKDMTLAVDQLKDIKDTAKRIKELKEKYTKPATEILQFARSMFNPLENKFKEAEKIIKEKMIVFNEVQRKKAIKKSEKIVEQVKSGKLDIIKAGEKLDKIEPKNSYSGDNGAVIYKTIPKLVFTNLKIIPRKYLYPNNVLIKSDLLRGVKIKGAKIIREKIVASK